MNRNDKTHKASQTSNGRPSHGTQRRPSRPSRHETTPLPVEPRRLSRDALAQEFEALDAAALQYNARSHGPLEAVGTYTDADGTPRSVCVNFHPEAASWRVIDVAGDGSAVLVERLNGGGVEETRGPAVAHARDYLEQWQRFTAGELEHPPLRHRHDNDGSARPPANEPESPPPHPAAMTMTYRRG